MEQIKLKIADSYDDITMNEYIKLLKIMDKYNLEDKKDILRYRIDQISILNPKYSKDDLMKLTMTQLREYFSKMEFLDADMVSHNSKVLDIDGIKYEFQDLKLMSLEQWIDSEKYSSSIDTAHKLVSIFFIEASKYSESELDKVSEYILNSPVTKYFYIISNFFFIFEALGLAISRYSDQVNKEKMIMEKVKERAIGYDKIIKKFQAKLRGFKS